jgi:Transposase and inactivated derivatives, TnpA family
MLSQAQTFHDRDEWHLLADELSLRPGMTDTGRLGFAIQLKSRQVQGHYPESENDFPSGTIQTIAEQIGCASVYLENYLFQGQLAQRHRQNIRHYLGVRLPNIYWHVNTHSTCIYSQLRRCSSSEVAAMMEGVLRHCTDMEINHQYVDSHGLSEVTFTFIDVLGFDLLPRLKGIARQKLYVCEKEEASLYPHLTPILTRGIDWEYIAEQYDEIIKYTAALKTGTAEPEAIL